ncbi:hypothetical protein M8J77_007539 [Diaphorina citri]|nr:hypothetical protein M8J77_007539 [Diaphorina citri]
MSPSYNHNTALEQSGGRRNFNKGALLMWLAHELSIPTRSHGCLTREADGLLVVLNPVEYVGDDVRADGVGMQLRPGHAHAQRVEEARPVALHLHQGEASRLTIDAEGNHDTYSGVQG